MEVVGIIEYQSFMSWEYNKIDALLEENAASKWNIYSLDAFGKISSWEHYATCIIIIWKYFAIAVWSEESMHAPE